MPTDSRRKHRRSPSPDDHDKSSKRHKHRHRHRHHISKKRGEEEIQFDAETVDSVKINHLPVDDVEEGEILDDLPFEVKDDPDLRSNDKNPGLPAKNSETEHEDISNDRFINHTSDEEDGKLRQSCHIDTRINDDDDSPYNSRAETQTRRDVRAGTDALGNGHLGVKSSKGDKWKNWEFGHFRGNEKLKGDNDDDTLEANRREVNPHRNSSESGEEKHRMSANSPLHDGHRSRSRSIGHTRDRSRSRSVVEEHARPKNRHSVEQGSLYYTSRHKTDYDLDEETVRAGRREHRHGSKDLMEDDRREHSSRYHSREARDKNRNKDMDKDRGRDRDVDRDLHREKKREETSRNKEVDWVHRREKERGRSHDRHRRDMVKDRSRERDEGRDRRREMERDRSRDAVYERDSRRETERDMSRDRTRGGERDRDWKSEWDYRNRERDINKERRDDRYRHNDEDTPNGKDKHMHREDDNDIGDRYKKHSRHEENGYHADRKRNYTMEEDGRKLKGEVEQDDVDEDTLELPDQEEEDLIRIKEESRRRREAIMEKYKKQSQQIQQAAENEGKDKDMEIHTDISKAIDGKSDDVEPSFSVGKSPPENVDVGSEKVPGAGGLGEGTPKSERSADKYCDDIFGETPTGVRKSGKEDGLLIERAGLHDNWDDAEGYYSYRFGEILDGRYEVTAAHGKGVFSTVVRARNLKAGNGEPDEVAIKIIRNNDTMYKAGLDELVILNSQSSADAKSYILISRLPSDLYEKYVVDANSAHMSGFTFVIISIVHLAGGKIPEENLWSQLNRMSLSDTEAHHPILGNIKQTLELLVQQRYLQKDKVHGPEGNIIYYELAERASDGPINNKVKEYISQIMRDTA